MSSHAGAAPWVAVVPQAAVACKVVAVVAAPHLAMAPVVDVVRSSGVSFGWLGRLLAQLLFLGQGWADHEAAAP